MRLRQQVLVERAPVGPDAHRLAVADGGLDDLPELQIALVFEADVAGVDPVFVERLGAGRMVGEQLVADIVEVADQRDLDAHRRETVADAGNGGGRLVAIDGQPHEFRAGAGERGNLAGGRFDVGGVGVGHRLDDDRRAAADQNRRPPLADPDADALAALLRPEGRLGRDEIHALNPSGAARPVDLPAF